MNLPTHAILGALSQQNVEIRKGLQPSGVDLVDAFSDDAEPFAELPGALFAADFESAFIASELGMSFGPVQGVEGFADGWRNWLEAWNRYEIQAEEFIDAGERVVVFARVSARTGRDGVEMEHAPAAIWTLRDGLVVRIEFYLDRDEALRAAGLAG